ncbi:hypothetical protein F53441_7321 [Fusarium austroafricanum]|uniref:Uncharacterized protein n=1 Tax=Fusarium austroafricanum TaxID=2364996 RepID=A0A8H4NVM8_9HYPO|nr:hypothetical protein F53441_7321 [Fusarium austroafricanum]
MNVKLDPEELASVDAKQRADDLDIDFIPENSSDLNVLCFYLSIFHGHISFPVLNHEYIAAALETLDQVGALEFAVKLLKCLASDMKITRRPWVGSLRGLREQGNTIFHLIETRSKKPFKRLEPEVSAQPKLSKMDILHFVDEIGHFQIDFKSVNTTNIDAYLYLCAGKLSGNRGELVKIQHDADMPYIVLWLARRQEANPILLLPSAPPPMAMWRPPSRGRLARRSCSPSRSSSSRRRSRSSRRRSCSPSRSLSSQRSRSSRRDGSVEGHEEVVEEPKSRGESDPREPGKWIVSESQLVAVAVALAGLCLVLLCLLSAKGAVAFKMEISLKL